MKTELEQPLALGRWRDWLLGAALLLALVAGVQVWIGWPELLSPWVRFPPGLLAALLALTALSYLARALRVQLYFSPLMAGRFPTTLRLSVLHTTANVMLPMRMGEMVFPWLMRRYFGRSILGAGVSLVWIRLLDLHFLMLMAIVIPWLREPTPLWPTAALAWVALLVVLPALTGPLAAWPDSGPRWRRLVRFVASEAPPSRRRLLGLYGWTVLCWGAKFVAFTTVLSHFLPVDTWRLLAGVMGAELSSVLPIHGVAGSGSYEVAAMAALAPLGVSAKDALAGVVNMHLFMLGGSLLFGALAMALPVRRGKAPSL